MKRNSFPPTIVFYLIVLPIFDKISRIFWPKLTKRNISDLGILVLYNHVHLRLLEAIQIFRTKATYLADPVTVSLILDSI